jgi:hypothetical protein
MVAVLASLVLVGQAGADVGVSIDTSAIEVRDELRPGDEYRLPQVGVRNPGNRATDYLMTVGGIVDQGVRVPPASWFQFMPRVFELRPGETRAVAVLVGVPSTAPPGSYEALVKAQIAQPEGTQVAVGAAAAARLSFTVSSPQSGPEELGGILARMSPFAAVLGGAVLLILAVLGFKRRFTLRLSILRRR